MRTTARAAFVLFLVALGWPRLARADDPVLVVVPAEMKAFAFVLTTPGVVTDELEPAEIAPGQLTLPPPVFTTVSAKNSRR